jgi:hypothetical protein
MERLYKGYRNRTFSFQRCLIKRLLSCCDYNLHIEAGKGEFANFADGYHSIICRRYSLRSYL